MVIGYILLVWLSPWKIVFLFVEMHLKKSNCLFCVFGLHPKIPDLFYLSKNRSIGSFGMYISKAFYICPNILSPSVFSWVEFLSRTCLYYKICSRNIYYKIFKKWHGDIDIDFEDKFSRSITSLHCNQCSNAFDIGTCLIQILLNKDILVRGYAPTCMKQVEQLQQWYLIYDFFGATFLSLVFLIV